MSRLPSKICFFILAMVALGFGSSFAQLRSSLPAQDSTAVVSIPAVIVTAEQYRGGVGLSTVPVNDVKLNGESANANQSVGTLLGRVEGMFIKDYGGLSQLKTLSTRGLGPEHTLVLLNGIRISSSVNGLTDLSTMSLDGIDMLQVVRGGQSAQYGADAVGGTVNLLSAIPDSGISNIEIAGSLGSFGRQSSTLTATSSTRWGIIQGSVGGSHADDDFPFTFHNGPIALEQTRGNADYTDHRGNLRWSHADYSREISATAYAFRSDRGGAGAFSGPGFSSGARQKDENAIIQLHWSESLGGHDRLETNLQWLHAWEEYIDSTLRTGSQILNANYVDGEARFVAQYYHWWNSRIRTAVGTEFANADVSGSAFNHSAARRQVSGFAGVTGLASPDWGLLKNIILNSTIRADFTQNQLPSFNGQAGLVAGVRWNEADGVSGGVLPLSLRANIGTNFRLPTFNELYYDGGGGIGNPNLRPEKSVNLDLGFDYAVAWAGRHTLSFTWYHINMNDRIIWVPIGGLNLAPVNLRTITSAGVEIGYRWTSSGEIASVTANYTNGRALKNSIDQPGDVNLGTFLPLIPQETGNMIGSVTARPAWSILQSVSGWVSFSHTSYRYTNEANTLFLPAFSLLNAGVDCRMNVGSFVLSAGFRNDNILNEEYSLIQGYPMPPGAWSVHSSLHYTL